MQHFSLIKSLGAGMIGALLIEGALFAVNQTDLSITDLPTVTIEQDKEVVEVVEEADPAVVSILISKDLPTYEQYFESLRLPFGQLQIRIPRTRQSGTETVEIGSGSGFLISTDGYIVTNKHVVSDPTAEYTVFTNEGEQYKATVVGVNSDLDVAVLKIEGTGFTALSFGDSDVLQAGQTVVAIGNALGEYRNTVSVGVVSGLSRTITAALGFGRAEVLEDVIQTDAAINEGNSGGPLLDLSGEVIGVNVATSTEGENISFALPSNAVQVAVEEIIGF